METEGGVVACHLCGGRLTVIEAFGRRVRVTSDCQKWSVGGALAVCRLCGTVQKPVDDDWRAEADRIYRSYAIYQQGAGAEQLVFDGTRGRPRSERIAEALGDLLPRGPIEILDIGCGNGAFLRALSARFPDARLSGTEFDQRNRQTVLAIPGVVSFQVGGVETIEGRYDLISLIHVLEHIADPVGFLRSIARHLKPGGTLLIEVPDRRANFFDLLIADHCTHFDQTSLGGCCREAGLIPVIEADMVVNKELTFVLHVGAAAAGAGIASADEIVTDVERQVKWLAQVVGHAREESMATGLFGIFGTSIAATWLDAELNDGAAFFVDEDPSRIGRRWLDRPILRPTEVTRHATVYVPLVPAVAHRVVDRLRQSARYVGPSAPL